MRKAVYSVFCHVAAYGVLRCLSARKRAVVTDIGHLELTDANTRVDVQSVLICEGTLAGFS